MLKPGCILAALLLVPSLAVAKDKSKAPLPYDVLHAQTVRVIIDPGAGISLADPQANQVAQRDVETALMNWGRYRVILDGPNADLIVVIRRGSGKMSTGTIYDPRQNNRPVAVDPTDTGIGIGVQRGTPPPYAGDTPDASQSSARGPLNDDPMNRSIDQSPHPQTEVGSGIAEDSFVVYRGRTGNPTDAPPVWRYTAKDCLKPHKVPAVDAFHKVVDQTEQAAAKQP